MPHISCKLKHCVQNITNTPKKQTFANTFAIILILLDFGVLHRELCVVFCKKYFMKLKTESKVNNLCMVSQNLCVILAFECQVSV